MSSSTTIEPQELFLRRLSHYAQDEENSNGGRAGSSKAAAAPPALSSKAALKTLLKKAVAFMEHGCRITITEDDVRRAAASCGLEMDDDATPSDFASVGGASKFAGTVKKILHQDFRTDPAIEGGALTLLHFFHSSVFEGESSEFTVKEVDGGRQISFDSPCGVKARMFELEWDLVDAFGDDENDDDDEASAAALEGADDEDSELEVDDDEEEEDYDLDEE